jgi:putative spermidine/putrescine transport system substrate-binding protein
MQGRSRRRNRGLALLALALLAACSRGRAPGTEAARDAGAPSRAREGALVLLEVQKPVVDGIADWAPAFEAASGCKLRRRSAADADDLLVRAASGEADLVLAGGEVAANLVAAGRVRPLDGAGLAPAASLPEPLRALPGIQEGALRYGLPVRWHPIVLGYDTRAYAQPPTSWSAVLAPAGEATPGLGTAEPIAIAEAALYLATMRPELRIADPYALDERQYAAALSLLRQRARHWRGAGVDAAGIGEALDNGVTAFAAAPSLVHALQAATRPVAWTAPEEGVTAQVEVAMLQAQARHPNCASFWLQWSQTPRAQALLAARAGMLPVQAQACTLEPLAGAGICERDGMALLAQARFRRVPQAQCGKRRCVPYSRWTRDYFALFSR